MKNYNIALVGATGLVGLTVLKILEERNLPIKKLTLFASKKSKGKLLKFNNKDYQVQELSIDSFNERI